MKKWKTKLQHHGVNIGAGERLTNIRNAGDLLLYALSCCDLVHMIELLIAELESMGLQLNPDKTRIMTTLILNGDYRVKVAGSLVEVLTGQIHINIWAACWLLVGYLKKRSEVELAHRLQIAWGKFHTHKEILTNIHVSLKLRLKYFDAIISPAALFGLASLPLVASQIQRLNVVQRRMLRAVVGWVAVDGNDWQGTMRRMNCQARSALEVRLEWFLCAHGLTRCLNGSFGLLHMLLAQRTGTNLQLCGIPVMNGKAISHHARGAPGAVPSKDGMIY